MDRRKCSLFFFWLPVSARGTLEGKVTQGRDYLLVDDFVGMGGTLANLRGYIEANGGRVLAAVILTGKPYSARLALDATQLQELRDTVGG